jgi:hypothetical protein
VELKEIGPRCTVRGIKSSVGSQIIKLVEIRSESKSCLLGSHIRYKYYILAATRHRHAHSD